MGGVHESSCHFIISLVFAFVVSVVFALGIAAGEKHKPTLYSFFNGMGFLGMVLELYSCISLTQTIVSYNKGATSPNILGHKHQMLINGLTYTAVGCHFVVFFSLFMALKFSFLVNWYFTYQDKLVFADTVRLKRGGMGGMHGNIDLGVAEIKDNNFKAEGLVKGMAKVRKNDDFWRTVLFLAIKLDFIPFLSISACLFLTIESLKKSFFFVFIRFFSIFFSRQS